MLGDLTPRIQKCLVEETAVSYNGLEVQIFAVKTSRELVSFVDFLLLGSVW